jgi:hypothetical protein
VQAYGNEVVKAALTPAIAAGDDSSQSSVVQGGAPNTSRMSTHDGNKQEGRAKFIPRGAIGVVWTASLPAEDQAQRDVNVGMPT